MEQRRLNARLHTGLQAAEAAWRRLETDGCSTGFQRFDWFQTITAYFDCAGSDRIVVAELYDEATGRPLILLPLVSQRKWLLTTLSWPGSDVCDYCAPLFMADAHWTAASITMAWQAIRAILPHADLLRIDGMPHLVLGAVNPLMMLKGTRLSASTTCGLHVDGDPATVLDRCCDPRFVKKLGKTGRRLAQRGAVHLVEARTDAEVNDLFDTLLHQRVSRFADLGRPDLLSQPPIAAFYRAAALQGLRGGAVRLLGLRVGDEWAGTYYGLNHHGRFQGLIVTIADETWRTCSPGLHVHAHVVRWVRESGLDYFDMSVGPAAYKDQIGGQRSPLYVFERALSVRGALVLIVTSNWAALKTEIRKNTRLYAAVLSLARLVDGRTARTGIKKTNGLNNISPD